MFRANSQRCHIVLTSFLVLAALLVGWRTASAQSGGKVMFILDASGSMWGKLDGRSKIEIAKKVLIDLVEGLPEGLDVGLVAYGHRTKGDCDDVQVLSPLAPLDKSKLIGLIESIKPMGKTPMIRSLKMTSESLRALEERTTIILISDGKETCDQNPCGFVKTLKENGIKFIMHVVGFGVSDQTAQELTCMAQAGGGKYYPAGSAENLKKSLTEVVSKVGGPNLIVSGFGPDGKPLSVWVRAYDGSGKEIDANGGEMAGLCLTPGTYDLTVKPEVMTQVIRLKGVEVVEGKVTKRKVSFAKSRVKVIIKDETGKAINGYARIVNLADGQYAEEGHVAGTNTVFEISPGKYLVDSECSNTGARIKSEPFELPSGQEQVIETTCAKGKIGVLVKDASGKPIVAYIRIVDVARDSYAEEMDSKTGMTYIQLPPGKYYVDIECPKSEKRIKSEPFDLKLGGQVIREITCQ